MMQPFTEKLWEKQDQHKGDRWRLFAAVAAAVDAERVYYPGSYVDIAPSFVFPDVTYLDMDKRAARFFRDEADVREIIARHAGSPADPRFRFIHGDYRQPQDLPHDHFDLLVSLYAGFISENCTEHLRIGGTLLVNSSHGDAAMASIDPRYALVGVVLSRGGDYRVRDTGLEGYLIPRRPVEITADSLHETGRGVAYTRRAFAYLFRRVR